MTDRVRLLALQGLLLGLSLTFLIVPASALFLDRYGAGALPLVYLGVAVAGVVLSRTIRALQSRLPLSTVAARCGGTFVAVVGVAWALYRFAEQDWVSAVLVGLFPLAIPVGFVLIGTQAGRLFDVRTMKESFARIVAGFSLGFVVGGLVTTALVGPLGGPVDLLVLDTVLGAAFVGAVRVTGRRFPAELRRPPGPAPVRTAASAAAPGEQAGGSLRHQRLFVVVFGYQLVAAAVAQILDYVVWDRAAYHFPDPSDLARFQGLYGTLINLGVLVFVFLVAGRLLVRFGERGGLVANPAGLLVLLLVSLGAGLLAGPDARGFLVAVCAQQVAHIVLFDGMTRAAMNTAYQAMDPVARLRAQTVVEAAGVPVALGFVGGLLLLVRFAGLGAVVVVVVTVLLVAAWLALALVAYRRYREGVIEQVTRRPWEPRDLLDADPDAVRGLLASGDGRDLMVGFSAVNGRRLLPASEVAVLLESPDPYARMAAVCELVEAGGESAVEAREQWRAALHDADVDVRAAALSACAASPDAYYVPHLVDAVVTQPPSSALADAVERHADAVAPLLVERSTGAASAVRERLVWALGVARDALPAAPAGLPDLGAAVAVCRDRVTAARAARAAVGGDGRLAPLRRALAEDVEQSSRRLADQLAAHHGRRRVDRVVAALRGVSSDRALAVELLDVLVGHRTGVEVAALLSGEGGATRAADGRTAAWWVEDLVTDPDGRWDDRWLRACALHAAPVVLGDGAGGLAGRWVDDADPVVAETARWAVRS